MKLHMLHPKIIGHRTESDDKKVVGYTVGLCVDAVPFRVYSQQRTQMKTDVGLFLEKSAKRVRDIGHLNECHAHLVKQWRKIMVIILVNQRNFETLVVSEFLNKIKTGEPTPDYYNPGTFDVCRSHISDRIKK
jgi:hypothetical protein